MTDEIANARGAKGEWRPTGLIKLPPIYSRPMRPLAIVRWLLGFPGYLWPLNAIVLLITLATWYLLTPELEQMQSFEFWWIAWVLVRNLGLTLLFFGGLHLYLYNFRQQGDDTEFSDKPFQTNNKRFKFGDQVRDNMFRTLGYGVPIFTAYEVLTYWLFANGSLGFPAAR